jgi:MscS family membrane protein
MREYLTPGGWLFSAETIEQFPEFLKQKVRHEALWKWIALCVFYALGFAVLIGSHKLTRCILSGRSLRLHIFWLVTPLLLLILPTIGIPFAIRQFGLSGGLARVLIIQGEIVAYIAVAWVSWAGVASLADLLIASPKIPEQSLNAHLLRLIARVFGIIAAIIVMFRLGNQLGAPLYSLMTGFGIGGIAFALAAQHSLENFIGSINLFADRPVRVGDFCRYGEDSGDQLRRTGTIEAIGLRSTRIRGIDQSLTTIPNGQFSAMHIINYNERNSMLLLTTFGLRYETTHVQLREVIDSVRSMLVKHPRVLDEKLQVRFVGFGDYSLDVEIRVEVDTACFIEFREIREDVLFRVMKIVSESDTSFAFPSRTIYHALDADSNPEELGRIFS